MSVLICYPFFFGLGVGKTKAGDEREMVMKERVWWVKMLLFHTAERGHSGLQNIGPEEKIAQTV